MILLNTISHATGPPITVKDSDMDKYKRKPPLQMFTRWLSNLTSTHRPKYSNRVFLCCCDYFRCIDKKLIYIITL